MSNRRWQIAGIAALVCLAVAAIVVVLDLLPGNLVLGTVATREVVGISRLRRPVRFDGDGTSGTVRLGEQSARVTAHRVELPGGRAIPIPPACKRVELRESRTGMIVLFDGVEAP